MIMLVLISNVVGILLREWRQCRSLTRRTIGVALAVLIAAVLLLTYGNYVGESATDSNETRSANTTEDTGGTEKDSNLKREVTDVVEGVGSGS
jgi:hypothetical protein